MDQDDPERRIAFSTPTAGKRGYNEDEVEAFLDRVEAARRDATGRTLTPEQVRDIAFSKPPLGNVVTTKTRSTRFSTALSRR
jgi:DivIVA domain-containing protein